MLYSTGPLVGIAANLIWGILSDKLQMIKMLLVCILAGQFIMASIMFQSNSYALLVVLLAMYYFFQAPTNALTDSLTLRTISGSRQSFASFRMFGSLGFAFASILFGMYMKHIEWTVALCMTTIGLSLLVSLFLRDARGSMKKMELSGLRHIVFTRRFMLFMPLVLVVSVSHRLNDTFLALYMRSLGADQATIGWAWATSSLSEIPIFMLLGKHGHKFKELPLLIVCASMYGLRFALMSLVTDPFWIIPLQTMHSVSFGIFLVTVIRYIQLLVPDRFRASGQAMFAMTWSGLAGLISGSVGGMLFQYTGPHSVYIAASILGFVGMAGFGLLHMRTKNRGDELDTMQG
jgi:PPP family 3-phenylpropionic acid transporter